jgi:hypothetical protein
MIAPRPSPSFRQSGFSKVSAQLSSDSFPVRSECLARMTGRRVLAENSVCAPRPRQQKPIENYRANRMENKTRLLVLAGLLTTAAGRLCRKSHERNKQNLQRV